MASITTDFIKIAQAGPTVDGRFIREDWLRDMAETYDPKTYTAMLWPEHCRWFGNYGEVLELQAMPDDKGVLCLYARLKPNSLLLWTNAYGQGLFYSLEVAENFADSGKAYLEGLGVTDSPASLGLESARFASRKQKPENVLVSNVSLEPLPKSGAPSTDEAPGWFKRAFPRLFNKENAETGEATPQDTHKEDNNMEYEEIIAAIDELKGRLDSLEGRVDALEVDVEAVVEDPPSGDDSGFNRTATRAIGRQFANLKKEFKAELAGLRKDFSTPRSGTKSEANHGAGGKKLL